MRTIHVLAAAGLAAALAAGCDAPRPAADQVPTVPASGLVRAGGKPAAGARVVFTPVGGASPERPGAQAEAGPDGTYRLTTYSLGDGAAPGEYVVSVALPAAAAPRRPAGDDARPGDAEAPPAGKYADPKTSPLRRTVAAGSPTLDPLDL